MRIVWNLPAAIFVFIGVTFSLTMSAEMCLALFCHVNIGTFNSSCQMVLDVRKASLKKLCFQFLNYSAQLRIG